MKKYTVYLSAIVLLLLFLASCKPAIKPEDLYGKWKYIKIEMPTAPQDTILVKSYLLATFHGSFTIDKYNINVSGHYNDGSATKLLFWVMKLTNKEIVFKILGERPWVVTAIKQ